MKGKLSIILLSVLCSAILFTGCGSSDNSSDVQTPATPSDATSSASSQMNDDSSGENSSISGTNWKLTGCTAEDGAPMSEEQIQENGGGTITFGSNNTCQMTIFNQSFNATYAENDGNIVLTVGNDSTTAILENETISLGWGGSNLIFTLE